MASPRSLSEIVTALESTLAFHREREAFYGGQLRELEEQRAHHAEQIATLSRKLETLKTAAAEVEEIAERVLPASPPSPPPAAPDPAPAGKVYIARLVTRIVEEKKGGEPFGISAITAEVNQRYRDRLRHPIDRRQVSVVLRWMLRTGRLRSVQKGRPFHESLYVKG
ncbi:MAG TPA: hypothetical protein VHC97_04840 [Thermoanaerobaculia bacterium]|jgi:chromosome segregation ATPase|nr:hypothetical protein [Thermoanaerobaculia bacterium]